MFTGIVQEVGKVISTPSGRLSIAARGTLKGITPGASAAVNGVCLTVTDFSADSFSFDVMPETRQRTNLGLLKTGDEVNLERALSFGGEVGGHLVQGHVDDTGKVVSITRAGESVLMRIAAPAALMRYVVPKGFIAVDGISLTVTERDDSAFGVSLVDYTLKHTNLGGRKVGNRVNLEVDIIAKYVEQFLQTRSPGITADFLQKYGFMVK